MIAMGMMLVFGGDPEAAYANGGVFKPTQSIAVRAIRFSFRFLAWLLSLTDWKERRQTAGSAPRRG